MVHGGFGFAFFRPDFLEEVGRDSAGLFVPGSRVWMVEYHL